MRPSSLLILVFAVLVLGSGLAALPEANQETCVGYDVQLFPYGTNCRLPIEGPPVFSLHAPSAGELIAWLVVTAALLGLAVVRRRSPWARGVGVSVAVLGLFGLLVHQIDYLGAFLATVAVLGPPLAFAVDALLRGRARLALAPLAVAAVTPLAILVVWTFASFSGVPAAGALLGLLVAALIAGLLRERPAVATA